MPRCQPLIKPVANKNFSGHGGGGGQCWGLTTVVGLGNSIKLLLPSSVPQH